MPLKKKKKKKKRLNFDLLPRSVTDNIKLPTFKRHEIYQCDKNEFKVKVAYFQGVTKYISAIRMNLK
jgi:predicted aspartyl protease